MKWIFGFLLIIGMQAHSQTPDTSPELAVEAPATAAGSTSSEEGAVVGTATEVVVAENPADSEAQSQAAATKPENIKNLKETEIPVQMETVKKGDSHESPFLRIFISLGVIGILGGGAFHFLRKYRYSNDPKSQAAQIKIITQHYLGPKKSLAIVRVAGESVLIGVTEQNITMIKSLSLLDEDVPEETPKEFHSVFSKEIGAHAPAAESAENKDDFSISGIKDFVSLKLKNMRSFE